MMSEKFNSDNAASLQQCIDNLRQAILQVVTHEDVSEETKIFLTNLVRQIIVKAGDGPTSSTDLSEIR